MSKNENFDLDEILGDEESPVFKILVAIIVTLTVIVVIGAVIGIDALIIWGIGNGIIWLFSLSTVWTFLDSLITALIIDGIGFIIKSII